MANFELRIYGINNSIIDEKEAELFKEGKITSVLSDKDFIELAEARGYVATLCNLLSEGGLFETRVSTYRAYLIDVDNEDTKPVRVDLYNTVISADKVVSHRTDYNPRTSETYETPIVQYTDTVRA